MLQERNEELAKRQARVSEGDMDTMRAEFQDRLSAAERRAYALQKERDSAKRAAEKATSLQDVIRERDVTIQQACQPAPRWRAILASGTL